MFLINCFQCALAAYLVLWWNQMRHHKQKSLLVHELITLFVFFFHVIWVIFYYILYYINVLFSLRLRYIYSITLFIIWCVHKYSTDFKHLSQTNHNFHKISLVNERFDFDILQIGFIKNWRSERRAHTFTLTNHFQHPVSLRILLPPDAHIVPVDTVWCTKFSFIWEENLGFGPLESIRNFSCFFFFNFFISYVSIFIYGGMARSRILKFKSICKINVILIEYSWTHSLSMV